MVIKITRERDLIFDLGMHYGEDTEFYLEKGFRVVAVEADPQAAANVEERFRSSIASGQLSVVNCAIAREDGPVSFFVGDVTTWGTTDLAMAERNRLLGDNPKEITVPGIRFPRLIERYGIPYYMKVDIEGADTLCLEGLLESGGRPKFVSIESAKGSFDDLLREFFLFQSLGYKKYQIIPQHQISKQQLPNPPREGSYVARRFREGCSGAFGKDLPGDWLDAEQALKKYMAIFKKYRITGDRGSLSGLVRGAINASHRDRGPTLRSFAGKMIRRIGTNLGLRPGWYDTHAMLSE